MSNQEDRFDFSDSENPDDPDKRTVLLKSGPWNRRQ